MRKTEVKNFRRRREPSLLPFMALLLLSSLILTLFLYVSRSSSSSPSPEPAERKTVQREEKAAALRTSEHQPLELPQLPPPEFEKGKAREDPYAQALKLIKEGRIREAKERLSRAVLSEPEREDIRIALARLYFKSGKYRKVVELLLRPAATSRNPELHYLLAAAYYYLGRYDQTKAYLRKALEYNPDMRLAKDLMARIERDEAVEGRFYTREYSYFKVLVSRKVERELLMEILDYLDSQYRELARKLDYSPSEQITVILYPERDFHRVTGSPLWAGGIYDGKIRVPLGGIETLTAELARVLTHELVHSFLHYRTGGNCPTWVHEGLAQLLSEGELSSDKKRQLKEAVERKKVFDIRMLERSFRGFPASLIYLAYLQSQSVIEYLIEDYSMTRLNRFLRYLSNSSSEEALKRAFNLSYASLQSRWIEYVKRNY